MSNNERRQMIYMKILEIRDLIRKEYPEEGIRDLGINIEIWDEGMEGNTKFTIDAEGRLVDEGFMPFEDKEYRLEGNRWN